MIVSVFTCTSAPILSMKSARKRTPGPVLKRMPCDRRTGKNACNLREKKAMRMTSWLARKSSRNRESLVDSRMWLCDSRMLLDHVIIPSGFGPTSCGYASIKTSNTRYICPAVCPTQNLALYMWKTPPKRLRKYWMSVPLYTIKPSMWRLMSILH